MIEQIRKELRRHASPAKKDVYERFFKTGKGEYGEGDLFIGITVPETRSVAKKFSGLPLREVKSLMLSPFHEERLCGILILVENFKKGDERKRKKIYEFYMRNSSKVNNWDLVDLSADKIVGEYLLDKDKMVLYKLANSNNVWQRRISIIATFAFIKKGVFKDTFRISEILLQDKHDLIHKAVGWMLREVGKRDQEAEEKFLRKHYRHMPRTALRYAIEKFDERKRKFYMKK